MRTSAIARLTLQRVLRIARRRAAPAPSWRQGGPPPVAAETVATAIPGVIAAGTKVEVIKSGFSGTEGPIGLARRQPDLHRDAGQSHHQDRRQQPDVDLSRKHQRRQRPGLRCKGRLISVQTTPGKTLIGVLYPKGQEATLSDNFDGKPYGRPNDLVVGRNGGVYFTEPGPNATPGQPPRAAALTGRLLRPARRQGDQDRRRHRASERHHVERR